MFFFHTTSLPLVIASREATRPPFICPNSCNTPATIANNTATLLLDGGGYDAVPDQFTVELQSPLDAIGQKFVTAGLSGNLATAQVTGARQLGSGLVFNGNEKPFGSFSGFLSGTCQAIATITATNPRVPNGLSTMIPKGQVGSVKINVGAAVGLLLTSHTAAWYGIRTLHKTGSTTSTLTIPIVRPVC